MKRPGMRKALPLLAGGFSVLVAMQALAAPGPRPRPEDFPDYARYIEAAVDYERALDKPVEASDSKDSSASKLCRDDSGGGKEGKTKKKNSCEGKYLMVKDHLDEETPHKKSPAALNPPAEEPSESLEAQISRATFSAFGPDQGSTSASPTAGLSLTEIPADDLRNSGVDGLLGLFDNIRMNSLASGARQGIGSASGTGTGTRSLLDDDGSLRLTMDNMLLSLDAIDTSFFGGLLTFGDGYSVVSATVRTNGNSLNIGLTAQVYTPVYIVDRDGTPGTEWRNAGATTIDHLAIVIPYLDINIQGVTASTQDNSLLQIDTYSPQAITVDLAGTGIGVAGASADGSRIGTSTNFLQFGPQSMLTVAAGTRVTARLSRPTTASTPFITLNGHVGDITLDDISLVDPVAGGSLRIGRTAVRGINLVDTTIFVDPNASRLTVDVGRGLTDVDIDMERVEFGNSGRYVLGDFYVRNARVNELRFSATPH